jgi:hypothetical protein
MTSPILFRFPNLALVAGLLLSSVVYGGVASKPVTEHRSMEGVTQVEIIDTAGDVDVQGWDKAELDVTGTLSAEVERLEITPSGNRVTVRVVPKTGSLHFEWGMTQSGMTKIFVKIPRGVSLQAHLVSADIHISGVNGSQELQTVSGDIRSVANSDIRVHTVSGDAQLELSPTAHAQVSTVSGDATITGGGGELSFQSVSGDADLKTGLLSRAYFKTVSGDLTATVGLTPEGRFEAETVSGDLNIHFAGGMPPAEYDVSSLSGVLMTCDGRKGSKEGVGPGSRLTFRQGAATARVRVDTKSGDVNLCGR